MGEVRQMPVPDGLDGMRIDAGLSRLLGLSRTVVAGLAEQGRVALDGRPAGKSDPLPGGAWLNVRASNTEPLLRLNVEAADEAAMVAVRDEALAVIRG